MAATEGKSNVVGMIIGLVVLAGTAFVIGWAVKKGSKAA